MTAQATRARCALAKRLGDYFVATDPVYDKAENIRSVGGGYADGFVTCYFSCIEGLVGLGRVTKDQRYLEEAKRIAGLAATVTNFDGLHSHGRLCAVRGFADLYALTGEQRWRDAAERDWHIFADRYLLPTGGVKEMLETKCDRDEGCAEADWLRLNLSLWRLTGEGRYLDAAERSLKNHFIYQQFPNGGAGHRLLHQVDGQPVAFKGLSEEAWWCCGEHWARAMVDVARSAVIASPRSLFINLAIDCDTTLAGPGGAWKAALRETADGLSIRLEPPQPVKAEVRIHRLQMCRAGAQEGLVEAPDALKVTAERGRMGGQRHMAWDAGIAGAPARRGSASRRRATAWAFSCTDMTCWLPTACRPTPGSRTSCPQRAPWCCGRKSYPSPTAISLCRPRWRQTPTPRALSNGTRWSWRPCGQAGRPANLKPLGSPSSRGHRRRKLSPPCWLRRANPRGQPPAAGGLRGGDLQVMRRRCHATWPGVPERPRQHPKRHSKADNLNSVRRPPVFCPSNSSVFCVRARPPRPISSPLG